mmetsp:Transcript_34264/g.114376  ORF Transcript_34264/g.114376 Transcript_34264/m.114376 type:complete len:319 (-) Transcript_34264:2580-3536(-)
MLVAAKPAHHGIAGAVDAGGGSRCERRSPRRFPRHLRLARAACAPLLSRGRRARRGRLRRTELRLQSPHRPRERLVLAPELAALRLVRRLPLRRQPLQLAHVLPVSANPGGEVDQASMRLEPLPLALARAPSCLLRLAPRPLLELRAEALCLIIDRAHAVADYRHGYHDILLHWLADGLHEVDQPGPPPRLPLQRDRHRAVDAVLDEVVGGGALGRREEGAELDTPVLLLPEARHLVHEDEVAARLHRHAHLLRKRRGPCAFVVDSAPRVCVQVDQEELAERDILKGSGHVQGRPAGEVAHARGHIGSPRPQPPHLAS